MRLSSHHFIFAAHVFCFTENQGPKKKQIIISEKRSRQKSFRFEKLKRKEAGIEVFLTFVPRFFFEISEKPDFWTLMWKTLGLKKCFPHKEGRRLKA